MVSSREVAKDLNKRHADILRAIENAMLRNHIVNEFFILGSYDNRGKKYKKYSMNEEGLKLLFSRLRLTTEENLMIKEKYGFDTLITDHNRQELEFFKLVKPSIENVFKMNLEQQKQVFNYRLDGYIPQLNLAIEFDENNHGGYNQYEEKQREELIKQELNCEFIRVSDTIPEGEALSIVIGEILKRVA